MSEMSVSIKKLLSEFHNSGYTEWLEEHKTDSDVQIAFDLFVRYAGNVSKFESVPGLREEHPEYFMTDIQRQELVDWALENTPNSIKALKDYYKSDDPIIAKFVPREKELLEKYYPEAYKILFLDN